MTRKETLLAKYGEDYFANLSKRVKNRHKFTSEQARAGQKKGLENWQKKRGSNDRKDV